MIEIWLAVAGLALAAMAYAVAGARWRSGGARRRDEAASFARRRRELEAEARAQGMDEGATEALAEELALATLDETPARGAESAPRGKPPLAALLAGGAALAAATVGLYALWGEPYAPLLAKASAVLRDANAAPPPQLEPALADRLRRFPTDADGWLALAHVRMRAGDYRGATSAFAALHGLVGANEQVDLAWARASYLADEGVMSPATRRLVTRLRASLPNHPELLELLAMDALRGGDYLAGARHLVRALGQPLSDARHRLLAETLALARARLDPERPLIEATITVAEPRGKWLTAFARPVGGGAPLAALRLPARRSQTVVLDVAASPERAPALDAAGAVEVVATLGEAGDGSGAGAQAVSAPLDAAAQPRIELALNAAPGDAPAPVSVQVSLAVDLDPAVAVFVIARDPDRLGPPLAVRRLFAGDLPAEIKLTDADAMIPGRSLSDLDAVQVLARASVGGAAMPQSGDWESEAVLAQPGAPPPTLRIAHAVP